MRVMHARLIHFKPDPTWVPFYVGLIFFTSLHVKIGSA